MQMPVNMFKDRHVETSFIGHVELTAVRTSLIYLNKIQDRVSIAPTTRSLVDRSLTETRISFSFSIDITISFSPSAPPLNAGSTELYISSCSAAVFTFNRPPWNIVSPSEFKRPEQAIQQCCGSKADEYPYIACTSPRNWTSVPDLRHGGYNHSERAEKCQECRTTNWEASRMFPILDVVQTEGIPSENKVLDDDDGSE